MLIRSPRQLRVLATPTRQEIVDALEAAGPCSMSELAGLLGRAATALYSHVQALQRAGLVVTHDERREGRHVAAVFDVADRPMRLDYDGLAGRAPIIRIVSAAMRLSQREFGRACSRGVAAHGPARLVWGGRARGWLTELELRELNELLARAQALLRGARPREGTRAVSLGFVLSPVEATGTRTNRVPATRAQARRKVKS